MTENKRFRIDDDGIVTDMVDLSMYIDNEDCCEKLNELSEKNNELRLQLNLCSDQRNEFHRGAIENANRVGQLEKENKELQERNNRQCKQLNDLYQLIEEKDWRALSDIMDDFQKADEQLQKEWKCYE